MAVVAFVAFVPQDVRMTRSTSPRKSDPPVQGLLSLDDRRSAARLSDLLSEQSAGAVRVQIARDGGETVDLSPALIQVLQAAAELAADGAPVTVLASNTELTTQEAANILNVSRQYLVRLIDRGSLAAVKVGAHRRIRTEDLATYKRFRDGERRQALGLLAMDAQLAGDYDQPVAFGPAREA